METQTSRLNMSNIIAACIVAVGLVSSARIIAQGWKEHAALPSSAISVQASQSGRPLASPPLSQETIQEQIRQQVLASPGLQSVAYNGISYRLSNVALSQITYNAKEDTFSAVVNYTWQPAMPSEGPQQGYVTLKNNGYNQYTGTVFLTRKYGEESQYADVCVK